MRKKKILILADWWAGSWDDVMRSRVLALFSALQREQFEIYVWHEPDVLVFDNLMNLFDSGFLNKITPEHKTVIENRVIGQYKFR